jgi:hypothetical protein
MFSPIESGTLTTGPETAARCAAERRRTSRPGWWAAVCAAVLGIVGCSGNRDELIATITIDAGVRDAERCVASPIFPATDMGLDLYFVLERSRDVTNPEWTGLIVAFARLVDKEPFAGVGVGLAVYPKQMPRPQDCIDSCSGSPEHCECLWECGCRNPNPGALNVCECLRWDSSCDEDDYAPSFEINRLNENPLGFLASLQGTNETDALNDPAAYPALLASLRYRNDWDARHRGRRRVVQVLVAKSLDSDCPDRDVDFAKVVGGDRSKTYFVALNRSDDDRDDSDELEDLDALAAIGGTDQATRLPFGINQIPAVTVLEGLIEKIRANDGRCEYLLPPPAEFDAKQVNLTSSNGDVRYSKVANRTACTGNPLGWYYDSDENPAMSQPTRIIACDGACKSLHSETLASGVAKIELFCPTVMARDAGAPSSR